MATKDHVRGGQDADGTRLREPSASVRLRDGTVSERPLRHLTAGEVVAAGPWRAARSARGQAHCPGYYWSATSGGPARARPVTTAALAARTAVRRGVAARVRLRGTRAGDGQGHARPRAARAAAENNLPPQAQPRPSREEASQPASVPAGVIPRRNPPELSQLV